MNARFAGVASSRIADDSRSPKTRECLDPPAIWFHSTARTQPYSTIDWIEQKRKHVWTGWKDAHAAAYRN